MTINMDHFWSQTLPNWIMALAAFWGVLEIVRGYFKLKKQQKENEQKIDFFNEQLNEFRKQTTQFEYQTTIMNENNKILENGIGNLIGILGKGQEAEEQKLEIERQRRIIEIRPNFVFSTGSSNPERFEIGLRNQGGTAGSFRIIDVSNETILVNPINEQRLIERGQEMRITGRPAPGQNANIASGQILLGFSDVDGNRYQQNIIKNYQGYQIGLPTLIAD
jgi:hypothetical protein